MSRASAWVTRSGWAMFIPRTHAPPAAGAQQRAHHGQQRAGEHGPGLARQLAVAQQRRAARGRPRTARSPSARGPGARARARPSRPASCRPGARSRSRARRARRRRRGRARGVGIAPPASGGESPKPGRSTATTSRWAASAVEHGCPDVAVGAEAGAGGRAAAPAPRSRPVGSRDGRHRSTTAGALADQLAAASCSATAPARRDRAAPVRLGQQQSARAPMRRSAKPASQ